jgi:divalent metal cation (Fe/Co/Zn/Cd) transporter
MLVECSVSLVAARQANSSVLFAFGSDSFVELLSACVVLLQFLPWFPLSEGHATRSAAILLFILCGLILFTSLLALSHGVAADPSMLGIVITGCALVLMPLVASMKRTKARVTNNQALAADAVQSATCAYLAAITLCNLAANALFHIGWIDSVGALLAVPIVCIEARKAWKGKACGCC